MEKLGWISPSGEFFECEACQHGKMAVALMDSHGMPSGVKDPELALESQGWARIYYCGDTRVVSRGLKAIGSLQRDTAETLGVVEYDYGY